MTDLELLRRLQDRGELRKEATAFFSRHLVKTAGPSDAVKNVAGRTLQFIKNHPHEIAGALVGSAAAAALQYAASKPGPSGKSREQRTIAALEQAHDQASAELAAEGKKPSFGHELRGATTQGLKPIVNLLAKHPGKAAIALAPTGAGVGMMLAKTLFK